MWKSPILDEIYALRERHAKRFKGDLGAMMKDVHARAAKHPGPVARLKPVKVVRSRRKSAV